MPATTEDEAEVRRLELLLAMRGGPWPAWALEAAGVRRYLHDVGLTPPGLEVPSGQSADLLEAYRAHVQDVFSPGWLRGVLGHLRELRTFAGGDLATVTPAQAAAFLDNILRTPGPFSKGRGIRTPSTRNRALAACSGMYRWAARTGRVKANPFAGIKSLRVHPPERIAYLSVDERAAILEAARGQPDGGSVWIALHAGLRRGEVARLGWGDVRLDTGRLTVRRAKTGRPRTIPVASALAEFLATRRPADGAGRVVPWPAEPGRWDYQAETLLRKLRAACPDVPPGHVRWNAFRHTFASLLVQAGVSLDKVAAWLGNSSEVCRRHYAEFMPRSGHDPEIDKVNGRGGAGRP